MNKILEIIVAAAVLTIILVVLMTSTTDALTGTSEATNQTYRKCQIQVREAERSDDPSILSKKCVKYASPSMQNKWEEHQIIPSTS